MRSTFSVPALSAEHLAGEGKQASKPRVLPYLFLFFSTAPFSIGILPLPRGRSEKEASVRRVSRAFPPLSGLCHRTTAGKEGGFWQACVACVSAPVWSASPLTHHAACNADYIGSTKEPQHHPQARRKGFFPNSPLRRAACVGTLPPVGTAPRQHQ